MNPTQQFPRGTEPGDHDIEASLGRLAGSMPTDRPGLAHAALREATSIRRRQRGFAVAGLAAALAIAVPVAWQVGRSGGPAPVAPAQVQQTSPSSSESAPALPANTSLPSNRTPSEPPKGSTRTQGGTAVPSAAAPQTVTLPVTGAPTGTVVRPYAVTGVYHGASGTVPIAEDYGVVGVLNLRSTKVLSINALGQGQWTTVQDLSGKVLATLQDIAGQPVANAGGDRFALVDSQGGRVLLFDDRGRQLAVLKDGQAAGAVGFAGSTVLFTRAQGTFAWDPSSGRVTAFDRGTAVDASDRLGLALLIDSTTATRTCWAILTTKDAKPRRISGTCTPGAVPQVLAADGAHVIATPPPGADAHRKAFVFTVGSPAPVLTVDAPAGAGIWGLSWRVDLQTLVLNVVTSDGADRLIGCGINGRCEVLTESAANPGWPEKETPYVLVRD